MAEQGCVAEARCSCANGENGCCGGRRDVKVRWRWRWREGGRWWSWRCCGVVADEDGGAGTRGGRNCAGRASGVLAAAMDLCVWSAAAFSSEEDGREVVAGNGVMVMQWWPAR